MALSTLTNLHGPSITPYNHLAGRNVHPVGYGFWLCGCRLHYQRSLNRIDLVRQFWTMVMSSEWHEGPQLVSSKVWLDFQLKIGNVVLRCETKRTRSH